MKHFGKNTLLFVKASDKGHQEYDSNIQVTGNENWGIALFRIWKNGRNWILMVHDGENHKATEIKTFADPFRAMQYAKVKYLEINLPEGSYFVAEKKGVTVDDKSEIITVIRNQKIYGSKKEYRTFSEYGGLVPPWKNN